MDEKMRQEIALHRRAVIAEAANARLTSSERGSVVRAIAARPHPHPDGTARRYSRGTIDRWLRAWRAGGVDGLRPSPRSDTGKVRAMPELFGEAAALLLDLLRSAVAAIGAAFMAAAGLPGWAVLGRWRFACAVTGGSLLAANASSPFLIIGTRRFMPPRSS